MSKISFKVSARTARLIGRENIASSKGAIIELVKNAYDADSPLCIVYFDNKYSELPKVIRIDFLKNKAINLELISKVYIKHNDEYQLDENSTKQDKALLKKEFNSLNTLYIIDSGEGMTQQIIRNNWMTIGTDNKAVDIFTKNGRIKAGAKGIGRFALDKLGNTTRMITVFDKKTDDLDENNALTGNRGYKWNVKWSDFEGAYKTIDSVNAELIGFNDKKYADIVKNEIKDDSILELIAKYKFENGTMLKISDLRDNWDDFFVEQIYSDLEVLIPPKGEKVFEVFLYSSLNSDKYGEIKGSVCDDFDYKLIAQMDKNQNVKIKISRNEFDIDIIPKDFFKRDAFKKFPYREEDLKKKKWQITKTLSQLLPGYSKIDDENVFNDIGVFDFTLYFMKKTFTSKDAKRFFYKNFMSHERKRWMEQFGGIKLFRDNFRVRPYGEVKDSAFDWLGLGARKAQSPAGIAKKEGGYRVNPDNIAGGIKISRLTNVNFEDKSSREGLQENKTFQIFKKIIAEIISIFEKDRAYIAREMNLYHEKKYSKIEDKEKAEELAKKIIEENEKKTEQNQNESNDKTNNEIILAQLNREKSEEIEKLKDEQKILRGLASSGIVMASFTHDLSKLSNVLSSRVEKLKNLIEIKITEDFYKNIEDRKNPFYLLEKMKKQDLKIKNWLSFSLGATRKDKRKRKNIPFYNYFNNLKNDWEEILKSRGIDLQINNYKPLDKSISFRAFEIDFDSIFNNLIINSIDSFNISKINKDRIIDIEYYFTKKNIIIEYKDNGSGLSEDIENVKDIFEPLFTTKRNIHTGDEEGTGLGMWLVKTICADNDTKVNLLFPEDGFWLRILFPIKYVR